jgi:thioredoxin-related protein
MMKHQTVVHAARIFASGVLVSACLAGAVAQTSPNKNVEGIAWAKGDQSAQMDALFTQARQQGKPLFLYWGAKWCPPCNQVKATVFARPDFVALSRKMIAVQLDGDTAGAQRLAEQFKVRGYPTMIVFSAQGQELMRLPGEVDAQQYLQALQVAMQATRPMAQVLAAARRGDRLSAEEWRRLAWYSWETDAQQLIEADQLAPLLRQLARACAAQDLSAQNNASTTRLLIKGVLAAVDARGAQSMDAALDPELRFDAGAAVMRMLGDGVSARQHTDIVTASAKKVVEALSRAGSLERRQLVNAWNQSALRLQTDAKVSRADRLGALAARVALAGLPGEHNDPGVVGRELQDDVRATVATMDRDTSDADERQAVVIAAADLLEDAGLTREAVALLESNLGRSHSPYYLMSELAASAKKHGDKLAALEWSRKAWEASHGPATRAQWGSTYVGNLIELAPEQTDRIEAAARRMLRELGETPDAYFARNVRYAQRMAGQLLQWGAEGAEHERLVRIEQQWRPVCRQLPDQDARRKACEAVFRSRDQR